MLDFIHQHVKLIILVLLVTNFISKYYFKNKYKKASIQKEELEDKLVKDDILINQLQSENNELTTNNEKLQSEKNILRHKIVEIENDNNNKELNLLKTQFDWHFLNNTLNNIYSLNQLHPEKTGDAINNLSELMKYIVYGSALNQIHLQEEIDFLFHFIELQKLRLGNFKPQVKIIGEINNKYISPTILLPLLENAYKHGDFNSKEAFMDIKIELTEKELIYSVINKLPSKKEKKELSGKGIDNFKKRLELNYTEKYKLNFNSRNDVFVSNLTLIL